MFVDSKALGTFTNRRLRRSISVSIRSQRYFRHADTRRVRDSRCSSIERNFRETARGQRRCSTVSPLVRPVLEYGSLVRRTRAAQTVLFGSKESKANSRCIRVLFRTLPVMITLLQSQSFSTLADDRVDRRSDTKFLFRPLSNDCPTLFCLSTRHFKVADGVLAAHLYCRTQKRLHNFPPPSHSSDDTRRLSPNFLV